MPVDALVEALHRDKKRRGDTLRFVILRDVGDPMVTDDVPASALAEVLASVQPS
jgi:3-dehydroquinate synthetase